MQSLRAIFRGLASLLNQHHRDEGLDDETFYSIYYGHTAIPKNIPIRLRKVLVEQLGRRWKQVKPQDNTIEYDEIDFAELIYEIEDEFDISIPKKDIEQLDGSFDSIVQYLARQCLK